MKILSRTDDTFKTLCQPKVDEINVTGDSITVSWEQAPIEDVLEGWSRLKVDSYDLMIHPAENKIKTVTKNRDGQQLRNEFDNLKGTNI